jgi:excinuclease ABC subunit C
MVVFEGGAPKKSDYRRFTIRGLTEGVPDDFAAMEEVLSRRMKQWEAQQDLSPHDPNRNESFATLPNIVVIDGGPGQLGAGLRALEGFVSRGVAVISLAKRIEEVFVPGRPDPILLDHDTPELSSCSACATRRTASRSPTTASGATSPCSTRAGRAARGGAAAQAHAAPALRLARGRAVASRDELEGVPGLPGKTARDLYAFLHRTSSA